MTVPDATKSGAVALNFDTQTTAGGSSSLQFPHAAPWLGSVQRRLNNSVGVDAAASGGQWLDRAVVAAANIFFQAASDLLPAEPHLYSSTQGDLVAEFQGIDTPLTLVVSSTSLIAIAKVGGRAEQFVVPIAEPPSGSLRAEISKITAAIRTKTNGKMDAKR